MALIKLVHMVNEALCLLKSCTRHSGNKYDSASYREHSTS